MVAKKRIKNEPTYISLFSGAGIGCYWFKLEKFICVSTVEILEKRLNIQRYNDKCLFESWYICWDIRDESTKKLLRKNVQHFQKNFHARELDVLIATPPCQGMSVANHKKQDEKGRNSLVVESIKLTKELFPKFFIFENVSSFLNTICTDIDGNDKKISEAIEQNLAGDYHIVNKIINFKNYWNNSSRTRTIVLGVRKDQKNVTPLDLFPEYQEQKTLYEVIGDLPELKEMGQISDRDIYHQFKTYSSNMRDWIKNINEGESAFDNDDPKKRPHKIHNGKVIQNQNKNGDKYKRQSFNKVAPCIHTRNDILSSQNTIHPRDDRVFSIRELMRMMTIPESFKWTNCDFEKLNNLSLEDKKKFLKREEMTIRHSIGEAVPTSIFQQIANKIKKQLMEEDMSTKHVQRTIVEYGLNNFSSLKKFIEKNELHLTYPTLLTLAEFSNSKRIEHSAYYTRQDVVFSVIKNLPEPKNYKTLRILEPSVGVGAFIPLLIKKYENIEAVEIDVLDIDKKAIDLLRILLEKITIPKNIKITYINADFFDYNFTKKYDIVVGNPPFGKIVNKKEFLDKWITEIKNRKTNNIFSFFIEKSINIGNIVSLIVPKTLLNAPEFNLTRERLNCYTIQNITDFWEKAFHGVKIETISFCIDTRKKRKDNVIHIDSYITNKLRLKEQSYITDKTYPYRLIYRNDYFDSISKKLLFDIYTPFRDRQITKKNTKNSGKIRVLKSRNIASNRIVDIEHYDAYIDDISKFAVKKYFNKDNLVLIPNLTYAPRACFLPKNSITDGSVAILTLKDSKITITKKDLEYYSTEEFSEFYAIARNLGTRSLNIDTNSVFYFGKLVG